MTESESRRTPNAWVLVLVLFVVACFAGLAVQLARFKPRRVEAVQARPEPVVRDDAAPQAPPQKAPLPAFGESTKIETLPEAVFRVAPEYPDLAREAGIEGTVVVQVLVGADGRVKGDRVVKSIPALDAAAVAAVEQWKFRPATSGGQRVAVWVAVPVRFSLAE
jgi:TonB family protein